MTTREDRLEAAVMVVVCTPHILHYLMNNDPKALEQCYKALHKPCEECGQGVSGEKASEHKSSCSLWVSDEPLHDTY